MAKLLANSTVGGKNIETVDGAQVKVDVAAQTIKADVSGLNREVAYLKLAQSAEERIEGGTVFADDFNGNRFGFTLNESESQNTVIENGSVTLKNIDIGELSLDRVDVSAITLTNSNMGGRKLVRASNGVMYTAGLNTANNTLQIFRSNDQGRTWKLFALISMSTGNDFALATYGTDLYVAYFSSNAELVFSSFSDAGSILKSGVRIEASISMPTSVTIEVGDDGVIHTAYAVKLSAYSLSNNIRYSTSANGGTSFSSPVYVNATINSSTQNYLYPNILLVDNKPIIIGTFRNTNTNNCAVYEFEMGVNTFTSKAIISLTRLIALASAVLDQNKNIHVSIATTGTSGYGEGMYAVRNYGSSTWTTQTIKASSQPNTFNDSAITIGKDGTIFIVYYGKENSTNIGIFYTKKLNDGSFSVPVQISTTGHSVAVLYDKTFSVDMLVPPTVIGGSGGLLFYVAKTIEKVLVPQTSGKLVYDVPATDYIGAFLKLGGALKASVYINNELAESTPVDGELRIVKEMAEAVPVKMRIELSRTDTTGGNNDNLTRILGGRA